jgi:hypothetical protein
MKEMINCTAPPEIAENPAFIFIVHGFAPEFSDGLAFRTDKTNSQRKKDVECPHCGGVFERVDYRTKIEVFRCAAKSPAAFHKTRPCKICRGLVAVRFI